MKGDLTLNLGGLHGPGSIDFLTSHLEGEDNTLVPDSAYGRTTLYDNVAKTGQIPLVRADVADFGLHSYGKRLFIALTRLIHFSSLERTSSWKESWSCLSRR